MAHELETLVLAYENGAETVSVIHQGYSQSGRAPSAPRKINISRANERWASLGAKERSVKNGGRRGGGREKNGGKNVKNRRSGNYWEEKYRFSECRNNLYTRGLLNHSNHFVDI